jgi:predicted nucleotide-binding protein (sugar kinase/HSP70/actin superfamily)
VYERELYNAFRFLLDKVDGIAVVVSMGCGPDSLVAEFMREEAAARGVPFLQLIMDEHTGMAGVVTRIEAFIELARRSRRPAAA